MPTTFTHRVRYHECDAQGFMFNGRYLELADVAMTEFFRDLGWDYRKLVAEGADPSVVSAELNFSRPLHFDDLVNIEVHCTHIGTSSFELETLLAVSGREAARTRLVYVNVDPATESSRPIPTGVAARMRNVCGQGALMRAGLDRP